LRKNTAPAIGLAATHLYREDPDALLLVLTADHVVHPKSEFLRALRTGARLAEEGHLVTFGMKPDRPATEYGYIEVHGNKRVVNGLGVLGVKMFREKPSVEQAEAFLEGGNFLWNSGMFAFSARSILGALEEYMPAMHSGFVRLRGAIGTERETAVGEEEFRRFKSISIDYAVMEKAKNILCVVPRFSWDDVGSWSSIARHKRTDGDGNIAEGNTVLVDCRDSIALGDGDSVVVLVGIRDLVVVKEGERFLVCHRSQDQRIREALKRMEADRKLRKFL
jgi:mannose-1-phosphate guanylyltransferase